MIAIINEAGLRLQLDPATNLVTHLATSWLSDDELPAEYSYPLECPLNENNQRFVGYNYRPDRSGVPSGLPVRVELAGVLYRRCRLAYSVRDGKLNGYLKIDSAEVYDAIRKLSLLEALPDVIRLGDGLIDGYNVATTALSKRMEVIASLPPGQFPLTFFPIRNEGFFEDTFDGTKLAGYEKRAYVNVWQNGAFKTDSTVTAGGYLVCPQFYLSWVLTRIMALAGYRIESDWLAQPEIQRLVIVNQTAMPVSGLGLAGSTDTILQGHTIVAGMYLPDMSVSDFLKAIKSRFALNITYNANERICSITSFLLAKTLPPAIDLTPYQSGPYGTDDASQRGFTVSESIDELDELYRDEKGNVTQPPAQVIGQGGQEISLKCGTTQLIYTPVPGSTTQFWTVPTVRQPGNVLDKLYSQSERYLDEKGKRKANIGLKLLSFRGFTTYSPGNLYPLATPDVRDGQQQVVGSQALTLGGRYGAWRNGLRDYYYFRDNTQPIDQPLLLPVPVLSQLKLGRMVQLSLNDQIRRSYLIDQLEAEGPGPDARCRVRLKVLSLPTGIELGADIDAVIVWAELIQGAQGSVRDGNSQHFYNYVPLTVKFWTTSSRALPASVSNLTVNLRVHRLNYKFPVGATPLSVVSTQEYILSYTVSGTSALVNPKFILIESYLPGTGFDYYEETVSIDPGEGYNVLR